MTIQENQNREWRQYLECFPKGEDVLCAVTLWLDYLGDGYAHKGLRRRSFNMAKRLLHIVASGTGGGHYRLGNFWRERLKEFGLKWHPETNEIEVIDKWRWMHALSILRQSSNEGRWPNGIRLPYRYYLQRIESGCHYDDPIDRTEFPSMGRKNPERNPWDAPTPARRETTYVLTETAPNPVQRFVWHLTEEM